MPSFYVSVEKNPSVDAGQLVKQKDSDRPQKLTKPQKKKILISKKIDNKRRASTLNLGEMFFVRPYASFQSSHVHTSATEY